MLRCHVLATAVRMPFHWPGAPTAPGSRPSPPSLEGVRVWEATSGKLIRAPQDPGVEAVG